MQRTLRTLVLLTLFSFPLSSAAATLTVTSTTDNGTGSLRQAIAAATDGDTIQFQLSSPATINLTSGDLAVGHSITITGPGASSLTINAAGNVLQDRIFSIKSTATVSISGLTMTQGGGGGTSFGSSADNGGAIFNSGDLSLSDCIISNNSVKSSGLGGGAIFNQGSATLSLTRCTVSGNNAGGETLPSVGTIVGGAIRNANGTVNLTDSTISNNYSQLGGGISSVGTVNIQGSTFSGNEAGIGISSTSLTFEGGAIYTTGTAITTIVNSTFVNNSAKDDGGAITSKGTMSVSFSTFSGNSANSGNGIAVTSHALTIKGNIFSNSGGNCLISGATITSDGYNLATDGSCALTSTGDLPNTPAGLDTAGLQSNGGPTQTIALLSNSAAIDAGPVGPCTDAGGNTVSTDQRGTTRPQGTNCDIGAYELQAASPTTVTNTNDSGSGSLRQAILNANDGDTITFNLDPNQYPPPNTITLTTVATANVALQISKNLTIRGTGADNLAISGGGVRQIFLISSGVTVSISGLTLENAFGGNGAAVLNNGAITLKDCIVSGNTPDIAALNNQNGGTLDLIDSTVSGTTTGAGLFNAGVATITGSTFSGNSGTFNAAIFNSGTLSVTNSTFAANQSSSGVGGIESNQTVKVSNSTFYNNSGPAGGAIVSDQGTFTIKGTVLAKGSTGSNCSGTIVTGGYNVSDDLSCTDLSAQTDINNTPAQLDSAGLQANGGPTQTVALRANSPALDAIPSASCSDVDGNTLTVDQRGTVRPQGPACDSGAFELVLSAPTVSSFSPASGAQGTSVTVTGTGFTAGSSVAFNNTPAASVSVDSDTQITATVPSGATTGPITVTTAAGTATSSTNFSVALSVTSFSPSSGPTGTSVTITGTGFTGATLVSFNGTSATSFTVNSDTQITATVPSGATTGPIAVTANGTASSASNFTVIPSPVITSFNPTSGPIGASVTIGGTGFTGVSAVKFNGVAATFTFNSDIQLTATVPAGASTGTITVTTPGGTAQSATSFTVVPAPAITSFTPTSGGAGASVTITGTALTGASLVTFNGTSAAFSVNSDTQITATVPSGATSGPIAVKTSGGTGTSASTFTVVTNLPPSIAGFSPASGGVGTMVTISGSNLKSATQVSFNGSAATFRLSGAKLIATVPAGATSGPISVVTPGGSASSSTNFTVVVAPTITGFSPQNGPVGTMVTIAGTNFTGAKSVMFAGKTSSFTVNSATQISATVPKGAKTGPISVNTPGGAATSSTNFTVN